MGSSLPASEIGGSETRGIGHDGITRMGSTIIIKVPALVTTSARVNPTGQMLQVNIQPAIE